MMKSLREKIQFYLIDCKTLPGKLTDIFIIILNLIICLIFVIETYPISELTKKILWNLEGIIVIFFIIEYIARLYGSRNRIKHIFNIYSIIDLIAILPSILFLLPTTVTLRSLWGSSQLNCTWAITPPGNRIVMNTISSMPCRI